MTHAQEQVGQPLANYAAWRRAGDFVFLSGVIAVDPSRRRGIDSYEQLGVGARAELASLGYDTGQLSVDEFEAPIAAQSWFVLDRIRAIAHECGGDRRVGGARTDLAIDATQTPRHRWIDHEDSTQGHSCVLDR